MVNAVKDLSDRLEMRVRKSLTVNTKTAGKKSKKKSKKSKTVNSFALIKPNNKQTTQQTTASFTPTNGLTTSNTVSASSVSTKDISSMRNDFVEKQQLVKPKCTKKS